VNTIGIATGAKWGALKVVTSQVGNFITIAILARALTPEDFGLVALANIALLFFGSVIGEGVKNYLIQYNGEGYSEKVNAGFWLVVLTSLMVAVAGYALAKVYVGFLDGGETLYLVLLCLLARLPVDIVGRFPDCLLHKRLDFKLLEQRDIVLNLSSGAMSIVLALTGWGVWALVLPSMIISPIRLLLAFRLTKWTPALKFAPEHVMEIVPYARSVTLASTANFAINNLDTLFAGRVFGTTGAGTYSIAWQLSTLVNRTLLTITNKLLMPYYSLLKKTGEDVTKPLQRTYVVLSFLGLPVICYVAASASWLVPIIYGSQWQETIPLVQILSIYSIRFLYGAPLGTLLKATGKPHVNLYFSFSTLVLLIPILWLFGAQSLLTVAIIVAGIRTFIGFITFGVCAYLFKCSPLTWFAPSWPVVVSALSATIFAYSTTSKAQFFIEEIVLLQLLFTALFVLSFAILCLTLAKPELRWLREKLAQREI
jgi:O-antigen/teichoic acid export membrane protein